MEEILNFIKEGLKIPSITSKTKEFEDYITNKFTELGYNVKNQDNIIILQSKTNPNKQCFCAHLDRIGLIKTNDHYEYSSLYLKKKLKKLDKKGKNYFNEIINWFKKGTYSFKDKIYKIIDSKIDVIDQSIKFTIDSKHPFLTLNNTLKVKDNKIIGQLDNIISIAVLYDICNKENFQGTILLSNNEEIGESYKNIERIVKKLNLPKKELIVLDTSTEISDKEFEKGYIMINSKELGYDNNQELYKKITQIAKENMIPFKSNIDNSFSELYQIIIHTKLNGISVRIPRKKFHTSNETTSLKCLKNYSKLIVMINNLIKTNST
ncbi:hypothetical protein ACFL1H_02315 [Nanoarchaeota archaeon]